MSGSSHFICWRLALLFYDTFARALRTPWNQGTKRTYHSRIMRVAVLFLGLLPLATSRYQCAHGKQAKASSSNPVDGAAPSWTQSESLKALNDDRTPVTPNRHSVNLDLPPSERWLEIGKHYADKSDLIVQYFEDMLPHAAVVAIDKIAKHLVGYKGFGSYGAEMKGYAEGLGLDLGYVVAANLVYQLER